MTIESIVRSLPNGLHDAELHRFELDYVRRSLRLELNIWVGDMDDASARESYRPAVVTLEPVGYFIIEPPDPSYDWLGSGPVVIDVGVGSPSQSDVELPGLPDGHSATWIYLGFHNRFMHVSSVGARLEWTGPPVNRT